MSEAMAPSMMAMATLSETDGLIPIRAAKSVVYCPREAWYRFVGNEEVLNIHMERGLRRHATFGDQAGQPHTPGAVVFRHLAVTAPELGVTGVLDEVEIGRERVTITEYKTSKLKPVLWPGEACHLAVQYLALREHAARPDWHGPPLPEGVTLRVYLAESSRYREVPWEAALERRARAAVARMRAILAMPVPPPGNVGKHCSGCQYFELCLPFERQLLETTLYLAVTLGAGTEGNRVRAAIAGDYALPD